MDYSWRTLNEIESIEPITDESFWNGISVWIERPHLLNRRLLSAELLSLHYISKLNNRSDFNLNQIITQHFSLNSLTSGTLKNILNNFTLSNELINSKNIKIFEKFLNIKESDTNMDLLLLRNLLPRNMKLYQDMAEVSLFDMTQYTATFYPMTSSVLVYPLSPNFPYRFKLSNNKIILEVFQNTISEKSKEQCKSEKWLAFEILPKIFKWCKSPSHGPVLSSLSLISVKNYGTNLHHLKEKYGKYYVQIWPDFNNTDPLKYVFEDISICAYLITLWEEERKVHNLRKKQTFVDLGCGNGLLVDILTAEGYEGIGIDVRKRKIWNAFKCKDKLIEMAIEPCNRQLFPDYDWIIGNHPDELTPWIPIVAARSSYEMKIFLIPCCYYTFNGKYSHCDSGLTRYQSYLKYIKNLCESVGFNVEQDRLRIPSTKRICFVCKSRSYEKKEELKIDLHRTDLINSEQNLYQKSKKYTEVADGTKESASTHLWLQDFKPRETTKHVRNCTDISRKTIDDTVLKIANILLHTENILLVECASKFVPWNAGGKWKICDLIKTLEPELLQSLKNQHGGLKTLLRNHGNIFEVKEGSVQIKVPVKHSGSESSTNTRCSCQQKKYNAYKTKKCFFYFNHPQKCPLSSSDCSYLHDE